MLTPWGIQTGFSSSTPTPGQDAASAESLESLPTLMPDLPWLLISRRASPRTVARPSCRPCRRPSGAHPHPAQASRLRRRSLGPAGCHLPEACWDTPPSRDWRWRLGNTESGGKRRLQSRHPTSGPKPAPPRVLIQAGHSGLGGAGEAGEAPCAPLLSATAAGGQAGGGHPANTECLSPAPSQLSGSPDCDADSVAVSRAGSASSCSRPCRVLAQLGLLAAQGPGEDEASCFSSLGSPQLALTCASFVTFLGRHQGGLHGLSWAVRRRGPGDTVPPHTTLRPRRGPPLGQRPCRFVSNKCLCYLF